MQHITTKHVVTWKRTLTGWQAFQQAITTVTFPVPGDFVLIGPEQPLREEPSTEWHAHTETFRRDCPRCMWGDR